MTFQVLTPPNPLGLPQPLTSLGACALRPKCACLRHFNVRSVAASGRGSLAAVAQSLSPVALCGLRGLQHARLPCPSLTFMSTESVMPSHPLLPLLLLPSIFPSIRVFSRASALHIRWPKHWGFSFSISSSNE